MLRKFSGLLSVRDILGVFLLILVSVAGLGSRTVAAPSIMPNPSATVIPTLIPIVNNPTHLIDSQAANNSNVAISSPAAYNFSSTKLGVYTGPIDINGHSSFEKWLSTSVPYATDYIDYRWGWTTDFQKTASTLAKQWGGWVSQGDRRLVLGVPMLESSNAGQFDQGVNGDFDIYFRDLANQLVTNNLGSSIIRLGYEANYGGIGPWQATDNPNGYKLLFRHEVSVMKSVPGAEFQFDWTVSNGVEAGHVLSSFDSFYPGDDMVNIVGIDIYDMKWHDPFATPQERWNFIVSQPMGVNSLIAFAQLHGKPLSYPEWGLYSSGNGFGGGGDDPYFVEKMADLFTSTKPVYQAYFDLNWGGGTLVAFPNSQMLFKQIFN